jgi:polysaccharide pyruvyl transferase CsaB
MAGPLRALVSGYYGFHNAGDEAILAGLVEGFRQRAPEAVLTVLSQDPAATEAEHGVKAIPRGTRVAEAAMREADLFISGGGGLLQDATSWMSPLYYLYLLRQARRRGLRVACIGQSIGPLRRGWIRGLTRRTLTRVDAIGVRDGLSRDTLLGIGLRREIEVTADLAFLLPAPTAEETAAAWRAAGLAEKQAPTAALAVRRLPGQDQGEGLAIARGAVEACRKAALQPVFVPMHPPGDVTPAEDAAEGSCEVVRSPLTARQTLALLGGFDFVIGMRLHALILASLCRVPLVGITYDPKVDGLLAELGLRAATSAQAFDAEKLAHAVGETWEQRDGFAERLRAPLAALQTAAWRNLDLCLGVGEEAR